MHVQGLPFPLVVCVGETFRKALMPSATCSSSSPAPHCPLYPLIWPPSCPLPATTLVILIPTSQSGPEQRGPLGQTPLITDKLTQVPQASSRSRFRGSMQVSLHCAREKGALWSNKFVDPEIHKVYQAACFLLGFTELLAGECDSL